MAKAKDIPRSTKQTRQTWTERKDRTTGTEDPAWGRKAGDRTLYSTGHQGTGLTMPTTLPKFQSRARQTLVHILVSSTLLCEPVDGNRD